MRAIDADKLKENLEESGWKIVASYQDIQAILDFIDEQPTLSFDFDWEDESCYDALESVLTQFEGGLSDEHHDKT